MHRVATGQAHGSGPQRIVRRRHQHFVAVVEQGLHGHHDQLGHTVTQVDVLDADAFDLLLLVVLHHGLAGAEQALGVAVALGGRQVADDVLEDFIGRFETKGAGLPMFSLRMRWPSSSRRLACLSTGPRMS